ncbi:MAG: ABC transporter ATP-binding protein [Acidimicrobiales bacterium]
MASISFDGVTKVFANGTVAVDDLSLDIADGEFTVVVGPSGSGKSTALRMVAGLEAATRGTLRIGARVVNDVPPRQRDIAMVFQSYALYPHMTVAQNLAFALRMQRLPKPGVRERLARVARRLAIDELLERRPGHLSGGQRQRVALGRAIVRAPQAFLMDEPLSNLDAKLRVEMRAYLQELHRELGTTIMYVTHDQTEALTMGDRVAVMSEGRLEQVAGPQELYDHPVNLFVAGFIGSPAMNVLRGVLMPRDDDRVQVRLGDQALTLPARVMTARPELHHHLGDEVLLGVRPEAIALPDDRTPPSESVLELGVVLTELLGSDVLVHCQSEGSALPSARQLDAIEGSGLSTAAVVAKHDQDGQHGHGLRVAARLPAGSRVAVGERLPLVIDPDRVHFFDPVSLEVIPVADPARDCTPVPT